MPTDPPSASQTTVPAPLGQAHPQHLQQPPQQPHRVPPHLRYPPQPLPHQQQPAQHQLPHHQQPQHLQRQQYVAVSTARNLGQMQPPQQHLAQQPQPLQQGQPIPRQPQRNPLNHQQPNQQPYYAVGGAYGISPYPAVASQYNINPNYMYHNPTYAYNGMQPAAPAQQTAPQNPGAPRQFTTTVPAPVSQRQPQSRVQVPPLRKKTILAIVDPDTNEEVKVSNVDAKPAASVSRTPAPKAATVKIPPRRSRPLELVSDPADTVAADNTKDQPEVHKNVVPSPSPATSKLPEKTVTPVAIEPTVSVKSKTTSVLEPSPVSSDAAAPAVEHVDSTPSKCVSKEPIQASHPPMNVQKVPVQSTTPANPSAVPPSRQPSAATEEPTVIKNTAQVEASKSPAPADIAKPSNMSEAQSETTSTSTSLSTGNAAGTTQTTSTILSSETTTEEVRGTENARTSGPSDSVNESTSNDVTNADSSSVSPESGEAGTTTTTNADTENPETATQMQQFVYGEGDRRCYPPDFVLSLRPTADPGRSDYYINFLSSNNIYKHSSSSNGPRSGDPRGSRSVRTNPGPLSVDPRGKRAFPTPAGPGFMAPMRGSGSSGMVGSGGVGSYDAFDLRSARSQNPPPVPKGQQSNMRDPRGTRQSGGRFDGPTRHGHGPIDPFMNHAPVEKLKRSEHGWKRNKEADDEVTSKVKQVRSLLNKLTLEKFDKLFKQIIDINISNYEILTGVVKEIFEKALFEPKFSSMYAELCVRLDLATRDMLKKAAIIDAHGKAVSFRSILLLNCKEEFTRFALASADEENNSGEKPQEPSNAKKNDDVPEDKKDGEEKPLTEQEKKQKARMEKEEADLKATKAKRRMLANVTFIGELFLKDLLKEHVIHKQCIQKLLPIGISKKEEDVLEALCKLLSKTGAKLSLNKGAIAYVDGYFKPLELMSTDHSLPARVRFMLQDLIEQRSNNWKLRREEVGAKTIAEIHKDIEKEEQAKAEAQAASRNDRRRGGGMHGRDRGPQNYPSRVPMTMPPRQKAGSAISRSSALLEKHGNRVPSTGSNFPTMRLGPKSHSGGSTSLRPGGGGRTNPFAALSDQTSTSSGQSGDARRTGNTKKWPPMLSSSRKSSMPKTEAVAEKPKLMDPEKLKRKTRSILEEYWQLKNLDEAKECLKEEVQDPNYPKFIEEALYKSLDAKTEERALSAVLFAGIIGSVVPGRAFREGFSALISQLSDIEIDNPRAANFLAVFIGTAAASRNLDDGDKSFGLEFMKTSLSGIDDPKRVTKLIVLVLAELYKRLAITMPDEKERQVVVMGALKSLDVNLTAKMNDWNPMRGLSLLSDMVKEHGIPFILPLLQTELDLKKLVMTKPTEDGVRKLFASCPERTLQSEDFMAMVIRVSFDWLFMDPPESIKKTFKEVIGRLLAQNFGSEIPTTVQMAAVLETQSFMYKNLDILPAHKEGVTDKPGYIAFECLYDADIVEEEVFMKWKDDTDLTTKVDGKEKMLMQTSGFFNWLSTAEVQE